MYEVRDLCHGSQKTAALMNAISDQTSGFRKSDSKEALRGRIVSLRSGCVIVRQTQKTHREIALLLLDYCVALANTRERP